MLSLSRNALGRSLALLGRQPRSAVIASTLTTSFSTKDASSNSTSSSSSSSSSSSTDSQSQQDIAMALAQSQATPEDRPASNEQGLFGKIFDKVSIKQQQQRIMLGEEMFQAATRQANDARWYGPGRIPRTFRSRHAMLTMHLWFLHKRLIASNSNSDGIGTLTSDQALLVQEELFEILWNDSLCRMRASGVREMSVNKSLLKVQQYTFLHLFHYDHIYQGLVSSQSHLDPREDDDEMEAVAAAPLEPPPAPVTTGNDDDDDNDEEEGMDPLSVLDPTLDLTKVEHRITELKKLVWMHILARDPAARDSDDHLTRMAWYIESQYQNILVDWPGQYVSQARVAWVGVPDFSNLRDNHDRLMEERLLNPDDVVPPGWQKNITLRGITYYWNTKTRKSQWDKPTGEDIYNTDDVDAVESKAA